MDASFKALLIYLREAENSIPEQDDFDDHETQLSMYDILIPILGVFVIIINLAVVISSGLILKNGNEPRSTYLFLGNVAMTDLVTAIAILFGKLYPKDKRDETICAVQMGMIVSSTLASVYSVGLIAFDRFLYILHGMKYQLWVFPERARILIVFIWILGGVIGFLPLMGWHGDTDNGRVCWFIFLAPKELILLTVIIGALPLFTVVILYSTILYAALKAIIHIQSNEQSSSVENSENSLRVTRGNSTNSFEIQEPIRKISRPSKCKAVKVVLFTFSSFVITWGPYFLACVIYTSCKTESKMCTTLKFLIASPLAILGFCNSLINPIIYAWWHNGFRGYIIKRFKTYKRQRRLTAEISNAMPSITPTTTTSSSIMHICACKDETNVT